VEPLEARDGPSLKVAIAYVRHTHEPDSDRETLAQTEAQDLLLRGAQLLGDPNVARHVITDRSTPEGLAALAQREGADVIVFCSDSHTAKGHVAVGTSAERLLEGGNVAVAIAPVALAQKLAQRSVGQIVAVGDTDGGARETAESLAAALGGSVAPVVNESTDMLVFDSRPESERGRTSMSASASHLLEIATAPVLVLPRGVALSFARSGAGVA